MAGTEGSGSEGFGAGDFETVSCRSCGTTSFVRPSVTTPDRYRDLYDDGEDDGQFSAGLARLRLDLMAELPDVLIPPPRLRTSDRMILAAIQSRIAPGARVLDIGCGSGRLVQALRRRGYRAVGAEVSERLVAALENAGLPALHTDGGEIPWVGDPPAAVTLAEVLEHLDEPVQLLDRVRRQFPDALVFASVPSPDRPAARRGCYESWDWPPNHLSRFTAAGIGSLFRRAGLSEQVMIPRPRGTDLAPMWWRRSPAVVVRRLRDGSAPSRRDGPEGHPASRKRVAALALLWGHFAHDGIGRALGSMAPADSRPVSASSMVVVGRPVGDSCR